MWVALPLITLAYVLPVATALASGGDWAAWDTGYWPVVAERVGGRLARAPGHARAPSSRRRASSSRCCSPTRACPTRWPRDGQMPAALARLHPRFGTPWAAVILSSVGYSVCAFWSFKELIVLNIWLYSIALILEMAAFVALRRREPALPRPWRVGGGATGMWLVAGLPVALLPARDGHRRMHEHAGGPGRRADRAARLRALARPAPGRSARKPSAAQSRARHAAGVAAVAAGGVGRMARPRRRTCRHTPARSHASSRRPPAQLTASARPRRPRGAARATRSASAPLRLPHHRARGPVAPPRAAQDRGRVAPRRAPPRRAR